MFIIHFFHTLSLYLIMDQGAAGTISLPHTDDRDNFLCQIIGKKDIVLIPPSQRYRLYVGFDENPDNYSPVDFFFPDLEKYPEFEEVVGKMRVTLEPGDILFIPVYWWHHVKSSRGVNMAVNYWYTGNHLNHILIRGLQERAF